MDKARLIISIRQATQAATHKLDVMVKPDVVVKEYRQSVDELLVLFKRYNSNFKDCQWAGRLVNEATVFTLRDKGSVFDLKTRLHRIERGLPSILDVLKR